MKLRIRLTAILLCLSGNMGYTGRNPLPMSSSVAMLFFYVEQGYKISYCYILQKWDFWLNDVKSLTIRDFNSDKGKWKSWSIVFSINLLINLKLPSIKVIIIMYEESQRKTKRRRKWKKRNGYDVLFAEARPVTEYGRILDSSLLAFAFSIGQPAP